MIGGVVAVTADIWHPSIAHVRGKYLEKFGNTPGTMFDFHPEELSHDKYGFKYISNFTSFHSVERGLLLMKKKGKLD